MEERESFQTDQHCELAINIDFSRGYIEGRGGTSELGQFNYLEQGYIHVVPLVNGDYNLLVVGRHRSTNEIRLGVLSSSGTIIAEQSITGEPPYTDDWSCSFVDTYLKEGNRVALICTPNTTHVYNPTVDDSSIRALSIADDSIKLQAVNYFYWSTPPQGHISCWHNGRIYRAGFAPSTEIQLDGALPATQTDIPEAWVLPGRSKLSIGPHVIAFTDQFDPAGIMAPNVFAVDEGDTITGIKDFREQLVIFTERSIYVMSGDPAIAGSQLVKVVSGVGCVSPQAIVEGGGALFFLSHDGMYVFDGSSATKLTNPIDSLWTGLSHGTHIPNHLTGDVGFSLEYPWRINPRLMNTATGTHYQTRNQVWFSLPIQGGGAKWGSITLVFDYIHGAISLYCRRVASNEHWSSYATHRTNEEKLFILGGVAGQRSSVYTYADQPDDDGVYIPVAWVSARHFKENEEYIGVHRPRFRMMSVGKIPTNNPPNWFIEGEEAAWDIELEGVANTDRQNANGALQMHPGADDPAGATDNTYFFGSAVFGTTKFSTDEWFTSTLDMDSIRSRWVRIGFSDFSYADNRSPLVILQSYSMDVLGIGTTRA